MYDMMIVGCGPAGLAAGVYAARKRLNTLLISGDIGGQVNWTLGVENYLGYQFIEGAELIDKFRSQMAQYQIEQKIGDRISRLVKIEEGFEAISETGNKYQSRVAILATGKRPRQLNVPGEKELTGKGVTYCAICDGPVFAGQRVAVVGGGNSALEAVLDMVKIAEHIDLVSLTPLTGDPILIEKLGEAKNLSVFTEYQTERIEGDALVESLVVKDLKSGESKRLEDTGVFIEIGLMPNSDFAKELDKNKKGEIKINSFNETNIPGIFAAGDVTDIPAKQIIIAAGEGSKALLSAFSFLSRKK